MSHLTSSWDSSRKQLFEAVLSCEGLPSPDCCNICSEGKVRVRCMECPVKFMCPSCDDKAHQFLPFHNRDGYVNGHFHAIPPTLAVHENGSMQTIRKYAMKQALSTTKMYNFYSFTCLHVHLFFFFPLSGPPNHGTY